jgi:uncharacterized OB-fold protein
MAETMTLTFDYPMSDLDIHFFDGLKSAELRGLVCETCDLCYVPPRRRCPTCLGEMTRWRTLGTAATIEAITIVTHQFAGLPAPPYVLAYAQPDGADSCILNYVEASQYVQDGSLGVGDRVDIRFKDKRDGAITDFCFAAP